MMIGTRHAFVRAVRIFISSVTILSVVVAFPLGGDLSFRAKYLFVGARGRRERKISATLA